MFYSVIEYFGPEHSGWSLFVKQHYLKNLSSFESVDGILCHSVFTPKSAEDWKNCINEDDMNAYITNLDYALKIKKKHRGSRIVGLIIEEDCDDDASLLGYDIIDSYNDVSLITNWEPFDVTHPLKDFPIKNNGLISTFAEAKQARELFMVSDSEDTHVEGCRIWAVHKVS